MQLPQWEPKIYLRRLLAKPSKGDGESSTISSTSAPSTTEFTGKINIFIWLHWFWDLRNSQECLKLLIYILLPRMHCQLIYFPQAPTSKLWKQAIFAWRFFFLIKHYKLRPEISSSFTAGESIKGEARVEKQNPSVTVQKDRLAVDAYNCLLTAWLIRVTYGEAWKTHL